MLAWQVMRRTLKCEFTIPRFPPISSDCRDLLHHLIHPVHPWLHGTHLLSGPLLRLLLKQWTEQPPGPCCGLPGPGAGRSAQQTCVMHGSSQWPPPALYTHSPAPGSGICCSPAWQAAARLHAQPFLLLDQVSRLGCIPMRPIAALTAPPAPAPAARAASMVAAQLHEMQDSAARYTMKQVMQHAWFRTSLPASADSLNEKCLQRPVSAPDPASEQPCRSPLHPAACCPLPWLAAQPVLCCLRVQVPACLLLPERRHMLVSTQMSQQDHEAGCKWIDRVLAEACRAPDA